MDQNVCSGEWEPPRDPQAGHVDSLAKLLRDLQEIERHVAETWVAGEHLDAQKMQELLAVVRRLRLDVGIVEAMQESLLLKRVKLDAAIMAICEHGQRSETDREVEGAIFTSIVSMSERLEKIEAGLRSHTTASHMLTLAALLLSVLVILF